MALAASIFCSMYAIPVASHAVDGSEDRIRSAVDDAIRPVMVRDNIHGMAVGITVGGKLRVFNYGVASTKARKPVTGDTLFELGSVTKTFTATLTSWAQVSRRLSLSDKVDKYLPALRYSQFGSVSLLNLGTHTPGGLPLQVPDEIQNEDEVMQYFKSWGATYPPGTHRQNSFAR
jgi:beta-lactamase class C